MTDDQPGMPWLPALFAEQMQEASEQAVESQTELFKQFASGRPSATDGPLAGLTGLTDTAMFKTRVQSGGRISIPDAEREALDIEEGDIVQAVVLPVKRSRSDSE
jgi:hypothetical protein